MPTTPMTVLEHPDKPGVTVSVPASTARALLGVGWRIPRPARPAAAPRRAPAQSRTPSTTPTPTEDPSQQKES